MAGGPPGREGESFSRTLRGTSIEHSRNMGDATLVTPVTSLFPPVMAEEPASVSFLDEQAVINKPMVPETIPEEEEPADNSSEALTESRGEIMEGAPTEDGGEATFLLDEPASLSAPTAPTATTGVPTNFHPLAILYGQVARMQRQLDQFRQWENLMLSSKKILRDASMNFGFCIVSNKKILKEKNGN